MAGQLTLVGTPIGNLGDMSPRAVEAMENCDFIAAEDTRVTMKLLNHFQIKKPLVSYYEHNKRSSGEVITGRILAGESCVLVTDAGMPAISDPGENIVDKCHELGIHVTCVPGPSAVVTALAMSGMPSGRFAFEGFLSVNKKSRREHLLSIKNEKRTMIFYEAPHKLPAMLADMYEALGDRRVAIVRELTKIHEEVIRTTLKEAADRYSAEGGEIPRGEFVVIVDGATEDASDIEYTAEEAVEMAKMLIEGGMSSSEAAKEAARTTGLKKGDIYRLLVK
ncbi:MAG: 16S rRNA (cytidine(1402)-2'-O)-methyltransferase [Firmicutes bacterium]|nr:16S rRNA (cytidine(1402)-2'-O)-methyltransferase [Bacillota bacterium]